MSNNWHKNVLVYGVFAILISLSFTFSSAGISVDYSLPSSFDGKTLYVGGDGPGNYTKIQDAIDDANNGDTVFVYDDSSPYFENIIVNKSLILIGENKETTIIDGKNRNRTVRVLSDKTTITHFTITHSGSGTPDQEFRGISIHSDYNNISQNNIINIRNYGIKIIESSHNIIILNKVESTGQAGILLKSSNNNIISENVVRQQDMGISLGVSTYNMGSYNILSQNIVSKCRIGIVVVGTENRIFENKVSWCGWDCLWLWQGSNNLVFDNVLSSIKGGGIKVIYEKNSLVTGNTIKQNLIGAKVGDSEDIKFSDNNFFFNIFHASPGSLKIVWNHNFWGRPLIKPKIIIGFYFLLDPNFPIPVIPIIGVDFNPRLFPYIPNSYEE